MTVLTIDEIREKVTPIAKKYDIKEVYLFGSYARGEADENSDVDLVIISDIEIDLFLYQDILNDLVSEIGRSVDLLTIDEITLSGRFENRLEKHYEKEKVKIVAW